MPGCWDESDDFLIPIFTPFAYYHDDINAQDSPLNAIFTNNIYGCEDGTCWAGGDTYYHYLLLQDYILPNFICEYPNI